jgi:hypothetical protein
MPIVSNSTPLIALSRIERLDILRGLFQEIIVPLEVYDELVVQGAGRPGAEQISAAGWIRREAVKESKLITDLRARGLGRGEAEAVALARETNSVCLTDDVAAITAARALGVPVRRTLNVLLSAKANGTVSSLRQVMDALRTHSFWIDDATYDQVLKLAGE